MAERSLTTRGAAWYWKRLRSMSATEVLHRIAEQGTHRAMWLEYRLGAAAKNGAGAPNISGCAFFTAAARQLPSLAWDDDALRHNAAELLDGRLSVMGASWKWSGDDSWHIAPDTGMSWPRDFFLAIPYRPGNAVGDIRVAWEPSRLQHLVALARLIEIEPSVATRARKQITARIESWHRANPPLTGIHYVSAMECALRILALYHAADLTRDGRGVACEIAAPMLSLITMHAKFVRRRLSRFSSANNHAVAEAAGLLYAGHLFPELSDAREWFEAGIGVLAREADRQIRADGSGAEQTFWYLRFVAQIYLLSANLLDTCDDPRVKVIRNAGERAALFLRAVASGHGQLPAIGDSDDGFALSPYAAPLQDSLTEAAGYPAPELHVFPSGGYSLARNATGSVVVLLDHGSLGLAPTYVHGHADALSICVHAGGKDVLIDPGTYTYNGDPQWRAFFRGTSAHNTVVVDGLDQAQQETSFMWSRPYNCTLRHREIAGDGGVWLVASHDGYQVRCGVLHTRALALFADGTLVVLDRLTGDGHHILDMHWHTPLDGNLVKNMFLARAGDFDLQLDIEGGETEYVSGREDPPLGWQSPSYGVRISATTLVTRFSGSLPHEFVTTLSWARGPHKLPHRIIVNRLQDLIDDAKTH